MLVLSRRVGEKIIIGNNIIVTVVGVSGDKTKLGIEAPNDISVNREEVHNRICQGQKPKQNKPDCQKTQSRTTAN